MKSCGKKESRQRMKTVNGSGIKRLRTLVASGMVALAVSAATAGEGRGTTLAADFVSAYVWRGITFNDGPVFQPSVDVRYGGFGVNVWGNLDIDDYDSSLESGEFSEVDFTLSYSAGFGVLDMEAGYIEYTFPGGSADADREVYLDGGLDLGGGVTLGATVFYNTDVRGIYAAFSLGYEMAVTDVLEMEVSVSAGAAQERMTKVMANGRRGGWYDINLSLGASYDLGAGAGLSAFATYVDSLDTGALPRQDINLLGGIGLSLDF